MAGLDVREMVEGGNVGGVDDSQLKYARSVGLRISIMDMEQIAEYSLVMKISLVILHIRPTKTV